MSYEELFCQVDDTIADRVHVELEKLNSSTNEINKLEFDLDEARNQFRQLLENSTVQIENCAKKLGNCVVKVRPYYDARIAAKEALQRTQKAAVQFERANSAHSAAKEMVYLAEEGLKTEGRTFDHAWQEMLNHATMRVNESESEKAKCEAEHKKTSQNYQMAETKVITLQKELKRAITKSRPYFELRIYYNQLLEKQKKKIKNLEKQVAEVKLNYAHALKNLEQISDEIHKNRQLSNKINNFLLENPSEKLDFVHSNHIIDTWDYVKTVKNSHQDKKIKLKTSTNSENDSSFMDSPDIKSKSEIFKISKTYDRIESPCSMDTKKKNVKMVADENSGSRPDLITNLFKKKTRSDLTLKNNVFNEPIENEKLKDEGNCNFSNHPNLNLNWNFNNEKQDIVSLSNETPSNSDWTEIKLHSPERDMFSTVKRFCVGNSRNELVEDFDVPHTPAEKFDENFKSQFYSEESTNDITIDEGNKKIESYEIPCTLANLKKKIDDTISSDKSSNETPKKINFRRQSFDAIWNSNAGEKVKEILSHSIMKLNISSFAEKKINEPKIGGSNNLVKIDNLFGGNESNASSELNNTSQLDINIFNRENSKVGNHIEFLNLNEKVKNNDSNSSSGNSDISNLKKDKFFMKKIPNPLEKTLNYLNADEESNSDSESLGSLDVLTDEQLSSLVLNKDFAELYQDLI